MMSYSHPLRWRLMIPRAVCGRHSVVSRSFSWRNVSTATVGSSSHHSFTTCNAAAASFQSTTTSRACLELHGQQQEQQHQQQQIRYLSSNSKNVKQAVAARDTRLAGRQRFYRHVSLVKMEAPDSTSTMDSPISAGVDGTDSASGVHHAPKSGKEGDETERQREEERLARYLIPRPPGESFDASKNDAKVDWYGVALDGHAIKTPMGETLQVPSRLLASQIAAEWNAVERYIQPTQMPAMTMTCTVRDQTSQFPSLYQEQVLKFVPTDTLCFFADPLSAEDRVLYQRQEQAWNSIHAAIEETVGTPMAKAMGTQEGTQLMIRTRKSSSDGNNATARGLPHSSEILDYARTFVESLDAWHLTALHSITHDAKSFWLGWALLVSSKNTASSSSSSSSSTLTSTMFKSHSHKDTVAQAVQAARIEEEFQIENWGLVEGGHDYDRLNTSVNLGAARLLCECLAADNAGFWS